MKPARTLQKRIAGIIGSAAVLLNALPLTAHADEQKTPSGLAFNEIQSGIEKYAEENKAQYAAFSTAVICGDELLYTGAFGDLNKEDNIPAEVESVYEWGSITKTLTWVSAMQLKEQGKLDLNKDVREYLPEGFFQHLTYDDPITMLNLMNHNAGFCETTYQIEVHDPADIIPLPDALKASEPAQIHRPGEVTTYSNWAAALAGYIVELVSGESYIDYVHHHIFEPLGMEHTAIAPDFSDNEWVAKERGKMHSYAIAQVENINMNRALGERRSYILLYPAGAAAGTISDIALFMQALADDSAPLFENPETQKEMFSPSAYMSKSEIGANLHGFWQMPYACDTIFHNGGTDACLSYMAIDPVSKVGLAIFTNQIQLADVTDKLPELIFGSLKSDRIPDASGGDSEDITGSYVNSRSNFKGLLKWRTYLNYLPVTKNADGSYVLGKDIPLKSCGNGVYVTGDDEHNDHQYLGAAKCSDGKKIMQSLSADYVQDDLFNLKFGSLCGYAGLAVLGLILLFAKFIMILTKKRKKYAGCKLFSLAQFAKAVSVGTAFAALLLYANNMGMTKTQGMVCGIIQMVCALICAITLLSSCGNMFSKKEDKANGFRYFLNVLVNAFAVFVIVFFEMYRFWGI